VGISRVVCSVFCCDATARGAQTLNTEVSYTETMNTMTLPTTAKPVGNTRLFAASIEEQILLSVHLLGKPTAAQLFRLYQDQVGTLRQMQGILRRLSSGPDRMLNVINPMDIAKPIRSLPFIYLDTTRSRRLIEQLFGVPFRRVLTVPSRDWRFLRHDVEMVDELISFELTARWLGIPFGYEPHFDASGEPIYPKVTIHNDGLTHKLRPQPDKTLVVGDYHLIIEHDCSEEMIECDNIIRDATLGRKHLVYDQLFRSGALQTLGWNKTLVVYLIDSKRGKQSASRKRIKRCLENMSEEFVSARLYFTDRQSFVGSNDNVATHQFVRGDKRALQLPCFSKSST
jgi:hypothetical protein